MRISGYFRLHPYLLGGLPSVADFGFVASLHAHLGRDPYPSAQMKQNAPSLFRWTERMLAGDSDMPEFPGYPRHFAVADQVSGTLLPILRLLAQDYLPELEMNVRYTN